jgi:hypothetical protein
MFTYSEVQAIAQKLITAYIDVTSKEVTMKASNGAPEWELRHISGKPVGAATFVNILMSELEKREEENDA